LQEITAAIIGAIASAFIMALANISNRRERDIRELFHRMNQLEKDVAANMPKPRKLRGL
tara:strand:+ start:94 stop:270 length:177 start_codon:yes stop_codon:yes gene_type:complete